MNVLRKQQLLDKLIADYHPSTTIQRATCEHLAGVLEQLETIKPGSPDHQRLVQLSQSLGMSLEEATRKPGADDPYEDLTPDALVEELELLLTQARALSRGTAPSSTTTSFETSPVVAATPAPTLTPDPTSIVAPADPVPECPYCHRAPCIGPDHHSYDVLHWDDPREVEKRDERTTAEMMEALHRQRHGDPFVR